MVLLRGLCPVKWSSVQRRAVTLFCCAVKMAVGMKGALVAQKEPLEASDSQHLPPPL